MHPYMVLIGLSMSFTPHCNQEYVVFVICQKRLNDFSFNECVCCYFHMTDENDYEPDIA